MGENAESAITAAKLDSKSGVWTRLGQQCLSLVWQLGHWHGLPSDAAFRCQQMP